MANIDKNSYSVKKSYALGDKYRMDRNFLAAELCYALPLIQDHIVNRREAADIDAHKLYDLMLYRQQIRYQPPSKGKDIAELLPFIRSFYAPWQQEIIKPDMITRSEIHAQFRKQAVIKVFKEATKRYNLEDKLDFVALDNIALDTHNQQLEKIDNWMGPSFSKLQYKKSGKVSKSKRGSNKISQLTVVMDCKKYRKRCLNSQEDWFKKFDGVFFARCLDVILKTINDNIMNDNDRKFIKLKFAKRILERKIKFKSASAKLLIPAGTLFACKELMSTLHEYDANLDAASIKQETNVTGKKLTVKDMHNKLMAVIDGQYNQMCNDCNIFDDNCSEEALTFEVDDESKDNSSVDLKVEPGNDDQWLLKDENMFIGNNVCNQSMIPNQGMVPNQSMMPIFTNLNVMDTMNNNQSMMPISNGGYTWTGVDQLGDDDLDVDEADDGEDIHDNQLDYDNNIMPTPFLPQSAYNGRSSGVSSPDDVNCNMPENDPYYQIHVPSIPQNTDQQLSNFQNYMSTNTSNQPETSHVPCTSDIMNKQCFYSDHQEQQYQQQYQQQGQQQCQQQTHQQQIDQMTNNFDSDNNFFQPSMQSDYNNYNNNNVNSNIPRLVSHASRGTSVTMSSCDGSTEYSVNSSNEYCVNQPQQVQSCQPSEFCHNQVFQSHQSLELFQQPLYQKTSNSMSLAIPSSAPDFEPQQVSLPCSNISYNMNNNDYDNYSNINNQSNINQQNNVIKNAFQDNGDVFPSLLIKPICVECGEQECRCNNNNDNTNMNNNNDNINRQFQSTNNFLNPNSNRIHQRLSFNSNRNERRSLHIEQMRRVLMNNANNFNNNNFNNNGNINNSNWR